MSVFSKSVVSLLVCVCVCVYVCVYVFVCVCECVSVCVMCVDDTRDCCPAVSLIKATELGRVSHRYLLSPSLVLTPCSLALLHFILLFLLRSTFLFVLSLSHTHTHTYTLTHLQVSLCLFLSLSLS